MASLVDERIDFLTASVEAQLSASVVVTQQEGIKQDAPFRGRRRGAKPLSPVALKTQLHELRESAPQDWIASSRLTIECYRSALEMLFDDAAQLESAILYWRSIASSSFAAGRLLVQTTPTRLARVASALSQRLHTQGYDARGMARMRAALPQSLLVTSLFPHLSTHQRHFEEGSGRSLSFVSFSPLLLTRQEACLHIGALEGALRDVELRIGLLVGQVPVDSPAAAVSTASEFSAKFGRLSTAIYWALHARAMPREQIWLVHASEVRAVLSQIACDLETNRNRLKGILIAHGSPSRWVRIWPVALLGPPIAWIVTSRLWRSRSTFREWLILTRETVRGFVVDWVLEPCLKILETVRHGSDTLITSKESLQSDLASLERMVEDFSRDQKTYSEEQIQNIAQRVKAGDMTPVLRVWEADIRTPVRSAVAGSLIRTLLIQVQKVKVDIALAMDGIEKMLRSQQLTFAFVGVAPSLLIVYALNGIFSSLLPTSSPTSSRRARRQAWTTTRSSVGDATSSSSLSQTRRHVVMGRSGSGKTSMRSVIFHNQIAAETRRLGATINAEAKEITFLADMKLDLWDCGGQESFMDNYLTSQKEHIFRGVHSLIYIFDVESPQFTTTDMHYFVDCLSALRSNSGERPEIGTPGSEASGGAFVHILIHKMDLVPIETRDETFASRTALIRRKCNEVGYDSVRTFGTSIWDETLYKAWSHIVSTFIPNVAALRRHLRSFADVCNATEVILFEGRTFLLISQNTATGRGDLQIWEPGRFEKITQVIKVFRLNCRRLLRSEFASMQVSTPSYTAVLDSLTPNTYIMVISTEPGIQPSGIQLCIDTSKPHFFKLQSATWSLNL